SSPSYSNIAIPHSLMMNSLKSAISVCIIPNFIQWGSNNVNIVILLAITHNDKQKFKDLFMNLINIFTSESWNKFVPSIRDYNDFATFVENYSQK
ncbi:MAG: PTS sugar transporter subunit IIA, partial [Erysipelothrix sp.]|nr:PTS sugar transporter subunit IIA [Erysipelothrix sp.]